MRNNILKLGITIATMMLLAWPVKAVPVVFVDHASIIIQMAPSTHTIVVESDVMADAFLVAVCIDELGAEIEGTTAEAGVFTSFGLVDNEWCASWIVSYAQPEPPGTIVLGTVTISGLVAGFTLNLLPSGYVEDLEDKFYTQSPEVAIVRSSGPGGCGLGFEFLAVLLPWAYWRRARR